MELKNAQFKGYAGFGELPFKNRNCVLQNWNSSYIDVIMATWAAIPSHQYGTCYVQGLPLSTGAAALVAPAATAFPYRGSAFASDAECEFNTKVGEDLANSWTNLHVTSLERAGLCEGAFLNFPYRNLPNYPVKYWSSNADRLSQTRAVWNAQSTNVLQFEQQVPLPMSK